MARTKQTARKKEGGKPLAMGRGKDSKPKGAGPKLGRVDRKVIIEYSSDEEFNDDNPHSASRGHWSAEEGQQANSPDFANISYACDNYRIFQDLLY